MSDWTTGAGLSASADTGDVPLAQRRAGYRATLPEANIDRMLIDEKDAAEVEKAWGRLLPFDKDVLRLYYIWEAPAHLICRRLRIRSRPASVLDMAIVHGKQEIAKVLKSMCESRQLAEMRYKPQLASAE